MEIVDVKKKKARITEVKNCDEESYPIPKLIASHPINGKSSQAQNYGLHYKKYFHAWVYCVNGYHHEKYW